jgi:peptidoglycan/LPS O-acetylase OafA/YrhL
MQGRFYRPELDILRFFAFSLVFIFHTCASLYDDMSGSGRLTALIANISQAGAYGVDLFFLLSAFLITDLFVREKREAGSVNIAAFYARRVLRIWPLYFFFLLLCLGLSLATPVQFPAAAVAPFFFMYGNWYLMAHPFFSPAGILWSVSIEEQFYLLWPWAARNLSRRGMISVAISLLILAWIARAFTLNGASWYNTLTRLDPIAVGILVSLLLNGRAPVISVFWRHSLCATGLAVLALATIEFQGVSHDITQADGLVSYPLACAGALAIFVSFLGAELSGYRRLIYLGRISYGLYVFHLFALDATKMVLLREIGSCPFWLRGLIAFPLTVAMAAASYRWLEMPFLRIKERFGMSRREQASQPAMG